MRDYLLHLAAERTSTHEKLNTMREYLQVYCLRILHEKGYFGQLAFLGGTALRFLYALPRFSEDIDFSLEHRKGYDFRQLLRQIKSSLELAAYDVSISFHDKGNVHSAFIRFAGLMYETGLSTQRGQKLSIKLEIDAVPPKGAIVETHLVNRYFPIVFLHYNLPSLLAGKLHALLTRSFHKGRDYYDIGWYMSRWQDIQPNFKLLNAALSQTNWDGPLVDHNNWRQLLRTKLENTNWSALAQDVRPFLEDPKDLNVITKDTLLGLLR